MFYLRQVDTDATPEKIQDDDAGRMSSSLSSPHSSITSSQGSEIVEGKNPQQNNKKKSLDLQDLPVIDDAMPYDVNPADKYVQPEGTVRGKFTMVPCSRSKTCGNPCSAVINYEVDNRTYKTSLLDIDQDPCMDKNRFDGVTTIQLPFACVDKDMKGLWDGQWRGAPYPITLYSITKGAKTLYTNCIATATATATATASADEDEDDEQKAEETSTPKPTSLTAQQLSTLKKAVVGQPYATAIARIRQDHPTVKHIIRKGFKADPKIKDPSGRLQVWLDMRTTIVTDLSI
jgi:hypothetical protein